MQTVIDEISNAAKTLGLSHQELILLPALESERVFLAAQNHFVASPNRRWWWEDFRNPGVSAQFASSDGWRRIPEIVPNADEVVWFIAEEDQLPHFPVFETTPRIVCQIIGECYGFEFYLVAKNYDWLVCETHHGVVHALGSPVEERLAQIQR
jgi:hypothetical protein